MVDLQRLTIASNCGWYPRLSFYHVLLRNTETASAFGIDRDWET